MMAAAMGLHPEHGEPPELLVGDVKERFCHVLRV